MTSIKPPGAPGSKPVAPTTQNPAAGGVQKTTGPRFDERVEQASAQQAASKTQGTKAAAPADPTRAVLEQLRAGAITPDQAVSRLTDLAVRKAASPAMRPVIEARLRSWMESDPTVRELMKQMGATVSAASDPSDP